MCPSRRAAATELIRLDDPRLAGLSGRGIRVAVIDSGVHASHPHVGAVDAGVAIDRDLVEHDDWVDRLGHGTAVAAAIREKAPGVQLVAVKIFDRELSTRSDVLVRAIDWASERQVPLVNLSLGTTSVESETALREAVERACRAGTVIVTVRQENGPRWLPGVVPGVVPVDVDWDCPRDAIRMVSWKNGEPSFLASGYPRPIPGVSVDRNLHGVSFAVANVSGFLARAAEADPDVSPVSALRAAVG